MFTPEHRRNRWRAYSAEISGEHPPNYLRLFRDDLDFPVYAAIAVEQHQIHRLPLGEILADAPLAVLAHGQALRLRKGREDGKHVGKLDDGRRGIAGVQVFAGIAQVIMTRVKSERCSVATPS